MTSVASVQTFKKNDSEVKLVVTEKRFGVEQSLNTLSSRTNLLSSRRKISTNVTSIKRVDIENSHVI